MRSIDFSSWQNLVLTLFGLIFVTLIGVGIRMLTMMTIQQRRERMNRQINERLRTLIAAYKALGGSFTGTLTVDPAHLRDLRLRASEADADMRGQDETGSTNPDPPDRPRRIRDIVEAALADILLLGTEEQVRLAGHAARELVAGRPVPTHDLVISLRNFIREALDLDPIPANLAIPVQGPARPSGSGGRNGKNTQGGGRQGGGGGGMGGGMGMGLGAGAGLGAAHAGTRDDSDRT
ncbi:hypothetical protein [Sphingobium sp. CFD-2]|uniref:hypothetical protein n=1 Tax=Sphingobium sp. CFD-2 TaxID=2878542 RepID=UPI00214C9BA7|nr:hypothetical protein [Sphingobium sp. CFD-2]